MYFNQVENLDHNHNQFFNQFCAPPSYRIEIDYIYEMIWIAQYVVKAEIARQVCRLEK
jgi:hypothetical protein